MRGTGLVRWGTHTVYAYFTVIGDAVRIRISADEADRFGLSEGLRVWVSLPGREPADLLLLHLSHLPPFVWAELAMINPATNKAAG